MYSWMSHGKQQELRWCSGTPEQQGPALGSERESAVLEMPVRGYFSALRSSALPEHLQVQESQLFPRSAPLPMSRCRTKSEEK